MFAVNSKQIFDFVEGICCRVEFTDNMINTTLSRVRSRRSTFKPTVPVLETAFKISQTELKPVTYVIEK